VPDNDFNADLRDIRFALYEAMPFDKLLGLAPFRELDRQSIDLVLDECAKFSREALAPHNRPGDVQGCRYEGGKVKVPDGHTEAYRAYCDNGWLGVSTPQDLGGMGLPNSVGVATGELSLGACCSLGLSAGLTRAAASLVSEHGTQEMKDAYLPKMMTGEWQGTMCLTEPQAGSAVGDIKCLAKPDGDHWLMSGTKSFITAGDHDMCDNFVHLVLARTPDAPKGFKGISLFVVPKFRLTDDGDVGEFNDVVCAGIEHKLGLKGSPTCTMNFGEDDGCHAWLIGNEGAGLKLMFHMMNEARIGVGLQGLSLASQAYLYAREYAKERVQGVDIEQMRNLDAPRVVIAHHPDVRRMLLWCKAVVEASRALVYRATYWADTALYSEDEEEKKDFHGLLEFITPICKAYLSDRAFDVTELALQVMGGYGYIAEYPVEQHMRDVKIASIYEGTNGIQALDLIGRKLAAKGGAYFRALYEKLDKFVSDTKEHAALGADVEAFSKQMLLWSNATMELGMMGMSGDQAYPVLSATPYLEMSGNTVCAWLLLEQAVVAHDKLEALYGERGATEAAAQEELCRDDVEARFYFNKIETARFFTHQILTGNEAISAAIKSGDRSALKYHP